MGAAVFEVEGIFDSDAADALDGEYGVADGESHALYEFEAEVGGMDGGPGFLLEVQAYAVTDARDVVVAETSVFEDFSGCGVDVSILSFRLNGGDSRGLGASVNVEEFLLLWALGGRRRRCGQGWRSSPGSEG